jgi:hypothetical protein
MTAAPARNAARKKIAMDTQAIPPIGRLRLEQLAWEADVDAAKKKLLVPGLKHADRLFLSQQIARADKAWHAAHDGLMAFARREVSNGR